MGERGARVEEKEVQACSHPPRALCRREMSPASPFEVWLEDSAGRRYPLAATTSLGRSAGLNGYGFPHEKVSRRHLLIHAQEGGEFWIVDLGSRNGTYVNGSRLVAPQRLLDGDAVNLGHGVDLRFRQPISAEQI